MPRPSSITPWAPDANYPAGTDPWSSQPTKVAPGVTEFTPQSSAGASAEELNYLINQIKTDQQALLDDTGQLVALNWKPSLAPPSAGNPTYWQYCKWNSGTQQWEVFTADTSVPNLKLNLFADPYDAATLHVAGLSQLGNTFNSGVISGGPYTAADFLPSQVTKTKRFLAMTRQGTPTLPKIYYVDTGVSGSWNDITPGFWGGTSGWEKLAYFTPTAGSLHLIACTPSKLAYSTNDGAAWTDASSQLGTHTSSTSVKLQPVPGANGVMLLASIGGQYYLRSTDGQTWTEFQSPSFTLIGGGRPIDCAAYGPEGFMLAADDGSGGTLVYTSTDGLTWSAKAVLSTAWTFSRLVSFGRCWIAVCVSSVPAFLMSKDFGMTWQKINFTLTDNGLSSSDPNYVPPTVEVGPTGAVIFNAKLLRFSLESGVPLTVT